MEDITHISLIVIGGSAGSLPVILGLVKSLPQHFTIPMVFVIHRQRNSDSDMLRIFSSITGFERIYEPEDKQPVMQGCIYIAPQNYHLLLEDDFTFSLDYSETILYSRPSIDVTFESAAKVYKKKLMGIILSGANHDGTAGMLKIKEQGGICLAQEPDTAAYPAMPRSAIEALQIKTASPAGMAAILKDLHFY